MIRVVIAHHAARGPYLADAAPPDEPLANPRARKMMSRAAYLAALALADVMRALGLSADERARAGYFLGVGGSAGSLEDVGALLDASIIDGAFSLPAFGDRGLAACNPLLAFQLMNNFTLCHGAILEGLGGPNGALFSRGAGTVAAIAEAAHAVATGECELAIAGGADVATHPVTLAELARDGFLARGLVPADGAGLVALRARAAAGAAASADARAEAEDIVLEGAAHASGRGRPIADALDDALARAVRGRGSIAEPDVVVLAPWGPPAADALGSYAAARFPGARTRDAGTHGDALAASPALALIDAARVLQATPGGRALVLALGVDGDPGAMLLAREAA